MVNEKYTTTAVTIEICYNPKSISGKRATAELIQKIQEVRLYDEGKRCFKYLTARVIAYISDANEID